MNILFRRASALFFAMLIALCAALCSCTNEANVKQNVDVKAVYEKLIATGNLPELTSVPERDLAEVYGIKPEKLKQWVFALSENYSVDAGEVAIFEATDKEYAEELHTIIKKDLDRIKTVAKDYSDPHQSEKLAPAEVVCVGCFVYVVVGENYNDLMKIMKENIG